MSGTPITASAPNAANVRADIARAAQRTGENFDFLLAQARIESSLDPSAKAETSSAAGLYQFTNATWLSTLERHGASHGYGWASAAISGGRITDPTLASRIMGLRHDPAAASLMAGELAGDNRTDMAAALGRQPGHAELYLGHFLGSGEASRFLSLLAADPDADASVLFPRASAANRGIFLGQDGSRRSLAEVMRAIEGKVQAAMTGESAGFAAAARPVSLPPRQSIAAPLADPGPVQSMSESLKAMFGPENGSVAPPAVKTAYARFEGFGL